MKLKIKFIVILYILSTFMIIGTKTPLNDSNVQYNLTTIEYKIKNGDTL